jgi:hypothetical protein
MALVPSVLKSAFVKSSTSFQNISANFTACHNVGSTFHFSIFENV